MNMFRCEERKIWSKKIVMISLLLLFGWLLFYFYASEVAEETCEADGVIYTGKEAVAKNKEITRQYEGLLTMETVNEIIDRYGFAPYAEVGERGDFYRYGNYASQFITDHMTDFNFSSNWTIKADEISLFSGEDAFRIELYTDGNQYFTFMEGWESMQETLGMMVLLLNVIIIIAVSNVFTEEYSIGTASVLLTTVHGKKKDIGAKIMAAVVFSLSCFLFFSGMVLFMYVSFYGTDGLNGSAALIGLQHFNSPGLFGTTIGAAYAEYFLMYLLSILANTCITLCISAICRQPFMSILMGLGVFILPRIYSNIVFSMLPNILFTRLLYRFSLWMPFNLPFAGSMTMGKGWMLLFVAVISILTIWGANCRYRDYQDA